MFGGRGGDIHGSINNNTTDDLSCMKVQKVIQYSPLGEILPMPIKHIYIYIECESCKMKGHLHVHVGALALRIGMVER